jgi:hypothetical protein
VPVKVEMAKAVALYVEVEADVEINGKVEGDVEKPRKNMCVNLQ